MNADVVVRLRMALARASRQYGPDAPETLEVRDRYEVAMFAERIGATLTPSEEATLEGLIQDARGRTPNSGSEHPGTWIEEHDHASCVECTQPSERESQPERRRPRAFRPDLR